MRLREFLREFQVKWDENKVLIGNIWVKIITPWREMLKGGQ